MKLFSRAALKLTAVYTGVLLAISVGFSLSISLTASRVMDQPMSQPPRELIQTGGEREGLVSPSDELSEAPNRDSLERELRSRVSNINGRLVMTLVLINLGVLVLGAGLSFLLARWTLRPIEKAMRDQARFVSDASHELRTPLAALIMENEVVLRDKSAGKQQLRAQVESNLEETKKLQSLSDTLLQITQSQVVTSAKEREEIIEQILKILVENAVKYDPQHRQPEIRRSASSVMVIDQGSGIAEEDLPYIFDRFYRAEKSRTSDGFGLGLSLARQLAHRIGAEISVKNNKGDGATFTLSW